jgi:hypothetical protein
MPGFSRQSRYAEGRGNVVADIEAVNRWQKEQEEQKREGSIKEKVKRLLSAKGK